MYPSLARLGVVAQTTGVQVEMAASRGWGIATVAEESAADQQEQEGYPTRSFHGKEVASAWSVLSAFPRRWQ